MRRDNLTQLLGIAEQEHSQLSLSSVLGKRLSQRLCKELQGRQRLAGPLAFTLVMLSGSQATAVKR